MVSFRQILFFFLILMISTDSSKRLCYNKGNKLFRKEVFSMKKILVLDFSPRKKGNSAGLCSVIAEEIAAKGGEAVSYAIRDIDVKPCQACGTCKKKEVPFCAQKDDFASMLPLIDECDGIVFTAPIYFGQIPGTAKNFIDRLYCFFNPRRTEPLFTVKESKKIAVLLPCGGGDPAAYQDVAKWVESSFRTCGITEGKSMIKNGLNDLWNPEDEYRAAIAAEARELADWLCE